MLPQILAALRILGSARLPGIASSAIGGMGAVKSGADARRDQYEGPHGGYPASLTPDEMEAIGLGRPSGMSRGYLTPAQMDQLDAYLNLTRKGYDDPRAFESDTERKVQDIMRVMEDPNWARQR